MPKIIDVIITKNKQIFVIVDKKPKFLYERKGDLLVADDDGFYNTYYYERPNKYSKAFGGREFGIQLKDGNVEHAFGQWWDGKHQENAPESIVSVGVATLESLEGCYVFSSGHISKAKLDGWLKLNEPSIDYYKYDKRFCVSK